MAARKQKAARPVPAALQRILDLAGRGVPPARMAREVEAIVAAWRQAGGAEDPAQFAEQVEELRAQLAEGVAAAEEALSDVDTGDAGAVKQARHILAALTATRDAADRAMAAA